ncbi:unnamed protein product [Amoebophrya sp. A25]|nr:unnamed protein product [Amoebophrya sp. A25]|eukprot:GSA25T00022066001.1
MIICETESAVVPLDLVFLTAGASLSWCLCEQRNRARLR